MEAHPDLLVVPASHSDGSGAHSRNNSNLLWIGGRYGDGQFRLALVGLTVALTNQGTAERKTLPTNSHGDFQFVNVPPGIYTLDIRALAQTFSTRFVSGGSTERGAN